MANRGSRIRAAVAALLLALVLAPAVEAAISTPDAHACCPSDSPAADSSAPCQYVAPLGCCSLLGLTATPTGNAPRFQLLALALPAAALLLPQPPVRDLAHARDLHGPPQPSILRTTVLRL